MIWLWWALAAVAQDRPEGLLWVHSDLPRVFPLQVQTDAGRDYYLELRSTEDERRVLGAYVRGGAFFRVLTPPGAYRIAIVSGRDWDAQAHVFKEPGQAIILDEVFRFRAGFARKNGWLLDLRDTGQGADLHQIGLCQRLSFEQVTPEPEDPFAARFQTDVIERFCG
ncbi:hypothetical protein BFP70_16525 [Thioclava sp. SK-1]|nr:hypothetical protein BFP70_16525 [Thioclava sp. SK-1]